MPFLGITYYNLKNSFSASIAILKLKHSRDKKKNPKTIFIIK